MYYELLQEQLYKNSEMRHWIETLWIHPLWKIFFRVVGIYIYIYIYIYISVVYASLEETLWMQQFKYSLTQKLVILSGTWADTLVRNLINATIVKRLFQCVDIISNGDLHRKQSNHKTDESMKIGQSVDSLASCFY